MHRVRVKLLFQITGCMDMHLMYIDSFTWKMIKRNRNESNDNASSEQPSATGFTRELPVRSLQ